MPGKTVAKSAVATVSGAAGGEDPLSRALRPPADESIAARSERQRKEASAKKRSEEIDKALKEEAIRNKRDRAGEQKMLLLGQAGAGKTTVLKQMRLLYDQSAHQRERRSWRVVVYLNLILAVRAVLEVFEESHEARALNPPSVSRGPGGNASAQSSTESLNSSAINPLAHRNNHGDTSLARLRLAPLLSLEAELRARLGAVDEYADLSDPKVAGAALLAARSQARAEAARPQGKRRAGPTLLLRAGWQDRLLGRANASLNEPPADAADEENVPPPLPDLDSGDVQVGLQEHEIGRLLLASMEDVMSIWQDPRIRKLRRRQKIDERADGASYFLEQMPRIAAADFFPTDDDIMRARVRTVGITEDRFTVDRHTTYRICDVGGSRSQRVFWASFFEDARAIIFLAPVSAFDQKLIEEPRMNRIDDSLELFASIVSNPLLLKVSLILFLNKIDVLERKLAAGIQVSRYFPEYDGPDDFEQVWRFFRTKFREVLASHRSLARDRPCYIHTTCATSTKQIKAILVSVQDTILRE
ncbi:G-alpha-domain-containing protein [Ceraceosorus guamensis]|uniref:G-alpha-domain-containing protein n=1 Tax=Ceraceosorus guamensis TaxID=1522189 RepID=A0A316W8M2_9BASI|nr:G-alpha-domain-containing protein [Ceraceosorus guamensis]PWN46182.1 G-alpha-domain-containing protein [Ceraceosorus guamensis]